jgi:hypothetical protein
VKENPQDEEDEIVWADDGDPAAAATTTTSKVVSRSSTIVLPIVGDLVGAEIFAVVKSSVDICVV